MSDLFSRYQRNTAPAEANTSQEPIPKPKDKPATQLLTASETKEARAQNKELVMTLIKGALILFIAVLVIAFISQVEDPDRHSKNPL